MPDSSAMLLERPPRTDYELYEAVRSLWGFTIPRHSVCPEHVSPFEFFADAFFARYPVMVLHGSRALAGKSRTLALLGMTEAAILGANVNILGGSGEQSRNVHDAMGEAWNHPKAPRWLLAAEPTQYETRLKNGSKVKALLASSRSVRGPHPQRLRMDEIDEMDVDILDAAMGQPMPDVRRGIDSQTVLSSTLHYPDGTMVEMMNRAADKGWPVYTWSIAEGSLVATHRGRVPIQDVQLTDLILTRSGLKPVQHVSRMGMKQTMTLHLDNGRALRLTPDHKVATPTGWSMAEELGVGDPIVASAIDLPLASPTVAPVVAGGHVRVLRGVLMPPWAMSACHLCLDVRGTSGVDGAGGGFQMVGVHTGAHSAEVIEAGTRITDPEPEGQAVSKLFAPGVDGRATDAVAPRVGSQLPEPAPVVIDDDAVEDVALVDCDGSRAAVGSIGAGLAPTGLGVATHGSDSTVPAGFEVAHVVSITAGAMVPVWDIGVHGEHEFVADSVVVHNCYRETSNPHDGWLTKSTIDRMRDSVTSEMWRVEFELGEPSSGNRAIDTQAVEDMFDKRLGEYDRKTAGKEMWIPGNRTHPFEEPDRRGEYITGVDWAKEQDFTVITTFRVDCDPWRLVAYGRFNRKPWPMMVAAVNRTVREFGGFLCHDGTGIGNVVDDLIDYERRLVKSEIMVGRHRQDMLTDYINAVEKGLVEAPRITSMYTEHKYATFGDIYEPGKQDNHLPDSIAAATLAWSRRKKTAKKSGPVPIGVREASPWKM